MNQALPIPDLAPIICEGCAVISIIDHGKIRSATSGELAAIQQSPAWHNVLEPATRIIASKKSWPVGTKVSVYKDDGTRLDTVTRSAPWHLGGHTWVVLVEGITACYRLDRVTHRVKAGTPLNE